MRRSGLERDAPCRWARVLAYALILYAALGIITAILWPPQVTL